MKTPGAIGEQPETSSQLSCTSKPDGEEDVIAHLVSPRHIESTDDDPQLLDEEINMMTAATSAAATVMGTVAARPATTETTAVATLQWQQRQHQMITPTLDPMFRHIPGRPIIDNCH